MANLNGHSRTTTMIERFPGYFRKPKAAIRSR